MKLKPSLKILVIDDCPDTRSLIKNILERRGFTRVQVAPDAFRALSIMQDSYQHFDPVELVLADWQMPRLSGIDLLSKMKIDARFKETIFIMVSSDRDSNHVMSAINSGVDSYVIKPVNPNTLFNKISTAVRHSSRTN
ncbi:response regulator [Bacteriovorax sp. Seq25_V]|uniref:response regulator n=1 Tax=Bacteriovorax sp. Seq25_V TaxID=1201288 RepID=UPI00038A3E61|nr:response regulator [Bacteriovorax sp. Seq25_V]EQC46079.1 response regulator receiver domain protein [Bacteriovorax sp. Seq25_V]